MATPKKDKDNKRKSASRASKKVVKTSIIVKDDDFPAELEVKEITNTADGTVSKELIVSLQYFNFLLLTISISHFFLAL